MRRSRLAFTRAAIVSTEDLRLDDATLRAAGNWLVTSASTALRAPRAPEARLASVSGIGPEVSTFLQHLDLACCALADAAQTASQCTAELMRDSSELDSRIAMRLGSGYAVVAS